MWFGAMTFQRSQIARAFLHLVAWVDYQAGGDGELSRRPARITLYEADRDSGHSERRAITEATWAA